MFLGRVVVACVRVFVQVSKTSLVGLVGAMVAAELVPTFGDDGPRLYIEHDLFWVNGNAGRPWTMDHDMKFWTYEYDNNGDWFWVQAENVYWNKYPHMTTKLLDEYRYDWRQVWLGRLTAMAMESPMAVDVSEKTPETTSAPTTVSTKKVLDQELDQFFSS